MVLIGRTVPYDCTDPYCTKDMQVVVPDLKISATEGATVVGLAELKTITCGETNYPGYKTKAKPPNSDSMTFVTRPEKRAVEVRARQIHTEYERKLKAVEGGETEDDPQPGPAVKYFREIGGVVPLVVGAYGECSQKVHAMMADMVNSRVRVAMKAGDGGRSVAYRYVRTQIGMTALILDAQRKIAAAQWAGPNAAKAMRARKEAARQYADEAEFQSARWHQHFGLTHPRGA